MWRSPPPPEARSASWAVRSIGRNMARLWALTPRAAGALPGELGRRHSRPPRFSSHISQPVRIRGPGRPSWRSQCASRNMESC